MPSTNGHGPKRAILYARVSTDEQARSGYSLAQQIEALRAYAAREGYEVLEEVAGRRPERREPGAARHGPRARSRGRRRRCPWCWPRIATASPASPRTSSTCERSSRSTRRLSGRSTTAETGARRGS